MAILLLGQNGQVARAVQARAARLGKSLIVAGHEAVELEAPDLARPMLEKLIRGADAIINATAYTAVDKAEEEPDRAFRLNTEAPGLIASLAQERGIPFVHISTDYVFDGSGSSPYRPEDPTNPLGVYGRTKRDGENAVREAGGTHAILRTSWVFSEHGSNFVKTMLRLGAERSVLKVVDDQVGGPTPAAEIAGAVLHIAAHLMHDQDAVGTYHFAGSPDVSWAAFAREIMDRASLDCEIEAIPSSDYATPAPRPLNSRLDCTSCHETFGIARPDWRKGLGEVLAALHSLPGQRVPNPA